ncbi:helix-turn-helix transcriptional regulator [Pseudophaeobacter sp.]|uniref:helix-turn-helix domain-containing protein n=1 Tax=Pseudophaeobacter sp. TaxID=1971739 RepID=UPI003297D611
MNITKHISANGLSREAICEEAKISRTFLSLIESGERKPGLKTVGKLANSLGVSVRDLRPDLAILLGDAA